MTTNYCSVLIAFYLCIFPLACLGQQPAYIHYSVDQGMGSSFIYDGVQDKMGFIWFGSEAGVNRFDGHEFEYFSTEDGLPDNEILYVKPDSKGRVWFLGYNGKVAYWENEQMHSPANDSLIAKIDLKSSVHHFLEDSKGRIWLGSRESMCIVDLETNAFEPAPIQNQKGIWDDSAGNPWIVNAVGNYESLESGEIILSDYHSVDNRPVIELSNGRLLRRVKEGLVEYHEGRERLVIGYENFAEEGKIVNAGMDEAGRLLIATEKGACRFEEQLGGSPAINSFVKGVFVSKIFQDNEGNIWVTTLGDGVYFFPSLEIVSMNKSNGLSSDKIFSLMADSKGRLWVGSDASDIDIKTPLGWEKRAIDYRLQSRGRTISMYEDQAGDHWIINDEYTACSHDGKIRSSPMTSKCMIEYAPDTFLVSFSRGVMIGNKEELLNVILPVGDFQEKRKIYHQRAFAFCHGKGKEILMATNQGIFVFDGQKVSPYLPGEKLLRLPARDLVWDNRGRLWVATYGWGLLMAEAGNVRQFSRAEGLTGNVCNGLSFDGDRSIWVATNEGLSRVIFGEKDTIVPIRRMNGLVSNEVLDVVTMRDTVWVATSKGLTYFPQSLEIEDSARPGIHLVDVMDGDSSLYKTSSPTLHGSEPELSFHFRGVKLKSRERLTYRYQLSGLDDLWRETQDRNVDFINLKPGQYEFKVIAVSSEGMESEAPATYSFSIATPFFEQSWLRVALVILVAGLIALGFWLQIFSFSRARVREFSRNLLRKLASEQTERFIYFKAEGKQIKIPEAEVLYFKSAGDYIEIFTTEKKYLVRKTMKALEEELDSGTFLRIHRSVVVRIDKVEEIEGRSQVTVNGEQLPVGKKYEKGIESISAEFQRSPGNKI